MNTNHMLKIVAVISLQMIVLVMGVMLRIVVFGFGLFRRMNLIRAGFKSSLHRAVPE